MKGLLHYKAARYFKGDSDNPADYLVVEKGKDGNKDQLHLQVKTDGKPDHRLMGAAWAALHDGFRGNKYSGPNASEALSKLKALYKAEKMPIPEGKSANKSGQRHSSKDQEHGNQAMYHMAAAGFNVPDDDSSAAKAARAFKAAGLAAKCYDIGPVDYAVQEAWDVADAANALALISSLACGELGELRWPDADEGDVQDVNQLVSVAQGLLKFVSDELAELAEYAAQAVPEPEPAPETEQAQAAEAAVVQAKSNNLPMLTYIKSLRGLPAPEQWFKDVAAAKFVAKDRIRFYSMLWGSKGLTDVELDYFTPETDFWDSMMGETRALTFDHGQDEATKSTAVIGLIDEFGDDDIGRWAEAQLERNHEYRKAVDKLISKRGLGGSSDSAPQYVLREPTGKSFWIKQWPWLATALTPTPAEPRMLDAGLPVWKAIGLADKLAKLAEHPGAQGGDMAKVAVLTRELNLYQLHI